MRLGKTLRGVMVLGLLAVGFSCLAGCDQEASGFSMFGQRQSAAAPTEQEQRQATYGGHTIRIDNRQTDGLPVGGQLPVDYAADREKLIHASLERITADGLGVELALADLIQIQVYNLDTAASTTPTGSQAATSDVAGTQSGTQTPSLTSTPRVDPGIALPVAVALPGGAAQSTGSSATGEGTATTTADAQQTATAQIIDAISKDPNLAQRLLEILTATPPPASTNGL